MFLQALPTQSWGEKEIELLLSEAYAFFEFFFYSRESTNHTCRFIWQSLFRNSAAHLKQHNPPPPRLPTL